jgi:hypothetical protein
VNDDMARAGRKRKEDAVRRATTLGGRRQNLAPPVEMLLHRLAAAGISLARAPIEAAVAEDALASRPIKGRDWIRTEAERRWRGAVFAAARRLGLMQVGPEYPIDLLHLAGHLAGPGEDPALAAPRAAAAARFADLHWRLFGFPASAQANGYRTPTDETALQAALERARHRGAEEPLTPEESNWLTEARHKAMHGALLRQGRHVAAVTLTVACQCVTPRPAQLAALRLGLQALADAKLPGRWDVPEGLKLAG